MTSTRASVAGLCALFCAAGCGGGDTSADGGLEAGSDAGGADTGAADAGRNLGETDAGDTDGGDPDAGPECTGDGECDDHLFCNGMETCRLGACAPGTAPALDDGVSCTVDSCDETGDVVVHSTDDAACADGTFCNGDETCDATAGCIPGTPPSLDDGIPCTVDACNETMRSVGHSPDDAACDDAAACTADRCIVGTGCSHAFVCACMTSSDCDDGNPCTDDTCAGGSCAYAANTAPCDDGVYCNGADVCAGSACTHAGDPCTGGSGVCAMSCSETARSCNAASGSACSDDGNPCTNDVCDGSGGCTHSNNASPCGDGLYCNGGDVCAGGACMHAGNPCASGAVCSDMCDETADSCASPSGTACTSDGNACTTDTCNGTGACSHPANTLPCDDGLYCNGTDTCGGGSCNHAGDPCAGGVACNQTCNEPTDDCHAPAGTPCPDDGMACTMDACNGTGMCTHTSAPETTCANHTDDDCDGLIDCMDPTCASLGCGPGGATCTGTTCVCPGGSTESMCTNGTDDDCDGALDCADTDCASGVICTCTRTRCTTTCSGVGLSCLAGTCARGGTYGWDHEYGEALNDTALAVAASSDGYYVAGAFGGSVSFGGATRLSAGSTDGYLVALTSAGAYRWDVEIGSTRADSANAVATDPSGNVIVVGYTNPTSTTTQAFVRKIDATGASVWTRTYDTNVVGLAVATDTSGNVFVAGYFSGTTNLGGGMRTASASAPDIFVLALTSGGAWRWDHEYDGGGTFDSAYALATDGSGNLYVGGVFGSAINLGGVLSATYPAGAFVASYTGAGAWRWDREFGSGQPDSVSDIEVSQLGDVVVGASFGGTVDFGGGMRSSTGFVDGAVWVMSTDGVWQWDHEYAGSVSDERVDGVGVDCAGNIVATGMFQGTVDFGGGSRTAVGGRDVFVVSLSRTNVYRWDHTYGDSGADRGLGALLTGSGRAVVTGSFSSFVDFGGGTRAAVAGTDGFVLELAD